MNRFVLACLVAVVLLAVPGSVFAANALIVHDGSAVSPGPDIRTSLQSRLTAKGYTVTLNVGVPAGSLSGYQQIWDLRYSSNGAAPGNPFTPTEVTQYLAYLSGGGSLFLMGENGISFGTRNQAIADFILAAGGGTVTLATTTSNSQTVQSPFTGPTSVTSVSYSSVGGVTSLPKGQFVTKDTATSGAAIALGPGTMSNATTGTLIAVFDVNFLQSSANANLQALTDNIISYLGTPAPATPTYTVTYDGNGSTGGAVPTDSGTYATGAMVTVKANTGTLVRNGYVFNGWNTAANGSGTSYAATGAATFSMGSANVTLYAKWSLVSVSGSSPTGTGTVTASFTGGDTGCGFTAQQFIPLTGNAASPPAGSAPTGVTFPQGLFNFTVGGCTTTGGTLTFTITYPQALDTGTQLWKYGKTASDPTSHWYTLPATISGNTLTFSITDGGTGDDDLTANGTIVDPDGPGVPPAVPTMGEWAMIIMTLLLGAVGVLALRRRTGGATTT